MKILHLSDIHFRRTYEPCTEGYKGMLLKMTNPLIPLAACLKQLLEEEPIDCLLISGDLTEDGEVEDYRFLKDFLYEKIGEIPIVVTLGNHDIKSNFRLGWLGTTPTENPYNHIEEFEEFTVISFDSSCYGVADGKIAQGQLSWLNSALKKTADKPVILMTHHHLLSYQGPTPELPGSQRLLELLRGQKNLICLINGHTHHQFTTQISGIPYFTVDSMSFSGEDQEDGTIRFEERSGYNLYKIEQGRLTQKKSETWLNGRVLTHIRID